jgi:meckelin
METRRTAQDAERYANILLQSYQNLNGFLCAFIDHSLPIHQYHIRNRFLLEKIFNYEFQIGIGPNLTGYLDNLFYVDNERTFTEILFYGEENTLFIWNVITFLFIDYLFSNYILAAIVTYVLNLVSIIY